MDFASHQSHIFASIGRQRRLPESHMHIRSFKDHPAAHVVARIISRVFDPVFIVPAILVFTVSFAFLNGYRWRFLTLLFILDGAIPGIWVLIRFIKNRGKDWDIHHRKERIPLFIITVISHGIGVLVANLIDRHPLAEILFGLWLVAVVFWLITYRWKISVHTGVNSVMAVMLTLETGFTYWWIWLIVPLVGWARVVNKHHSVSQVAAGIIVPPMVLIPTYMILGVW